MRQLNSLAEVTRLWEQEAAMATEGETTTTTAASLTSSPRRAAASRAASGFVVMAGEYYRTVVYLRPDLR